MDALNLLLLDILKSNLHILKMNIALGALTCFKNIEIGSFSFLWLDMKQKITVFLFSTPKAAKRIVTEFPNLCVLTSEIHEVAPNHFGEKYFGTDRAE